MLLSCDLSYQLSMLDGAYLLMQESALLHAGSLCFSVPALLCSKVQGKQVSFFLFTAGSAGGQPVPQLPAG